jgi:hypothetical protein
VLDFIDAAAIVTTARANRATQSRTRRENAETEAVEVLSDEEPPSPPRIIVLRSHNQ